MKGCFFGASSGSALYLLPTFDPGLTARVTAAPSTEWAAGAALVSYFPDRKCDNGFAATGGTTLVDVGSASALRRYGFVFHTEAQQIVGRVSHGLWAEGTYAGNADTTHPINVTYGESFPLDNDLMRYVVNATSNVGNLAGVSATFTSGPIQNAINCAPRYGRIIRHAPGGVRTVSIFLVDTDPVENVAGASFALSPWTANDEVIGPDVFVPPAGWIEVGSVTGWTSITGRQRENAYAYPLCDYLIISSADEITRIKIRSCKPPRKLHIPYKEWWEELDQADKMEERGEPQQAVMEQRRRAYEHAHQNWEVITRWCNDVWKARQITKRGCPQPVDYVETGPFHPPHSHPREPVQFEENYLNLERWARPANVCWSGGIHIANKRVLEREENNLLTVERWANTMSFGLLFTPGCIGQ